MVVDVACSDDGGGSEVDDGMDSGPAPIRADARTSGADAEAAQSTVRFAHLAAETAPIDFCYREAHAGSFVGPVLNGPVIPKADAGDGGDDDGGDAEGGDGRDRGDLRDAAIEVPPDAALARPSLAYGEATKYLVLQSSGPMTIAIVESGATSCAQPIASGDVTLDPGKLSTVALFSRPGDGGVALEVASFTDDRTTAGGTARVRVIHGALGTSYAPAEEALAVRANAAKTTVLADRVEPRRAATLSEAVGVDALGYVTVAPIPPPATLAIGPAPTDGGADAGFDPWLSKAYDLALTGGSLHTAFVLPPLRSGAPIADPDASARKSAFSVLWCADTTTSGDRTTCSWVR